MFKWIAIAVVVLPVAGLGILRVRHEIREARPLGPIDVEASRDIQEADTHSFGYASYNGHVVRLTGKSYACGHDDSADLCFEFHGNQSINVHCLAANSAIEDRAALVPAGAKVTAQGRTYSNDDDPFLFLRHCEIVDVRG